MRKIILFVLTAVLLALPIYAAERVEAPRRPSRPERPAHPSLPSHPQKDKSRVPPIWIEIRGDDDSTARDEPKYDGTIYVVPGSPSQWSRSVDVGAGTFILSAPLSFPPSLKSADVAQIRAIFNDAVDRRTVDSIVEENATRFSAGGRTASGRGLGDVELIQIVVEHISGGTFVQNLSIGLDSLTLGSH
ncbi:MAG: hypothetical protein LBO21_03230 [Synergistaceae bacterium]|nr:hypothetical protein [Synergistaceae bacterium]